MIFDAQPFCERSQWSASPYINHFLQPDSIIPELSNPQSWNRYSYTLNNPVRYNDPFGHKVEEGDGAGAPTCDKKCLDSLKKDDGGNGGDKVRPRPRPRAPTCHLCNVFDGYQIQFTVAVGVPADYEKYLTKYGLYTKPGAFPNTPTVIFGGISIVIDKYGGVQVYGLTLDQDVMTFEQGPLQEIHGSYMLAANANIAVGVINGEGFEERGTEAYEGQSRDYSVGVTSFSYDYYQGYNQQTGQLDPTLLSGHDISYGWGSPLSGGILSTYAHPLTPRIGVPRR